MSFDDVLSMFDMESQKLENLISKSFDPTFEISEIVELYYQVMNVSSICTMLTSQYIGDEYKSLLTKINEIKKLISEKFNSEIHPKILEFLTNSIQKTTQTLQSNSNEKIRDKIENESKLFEELRKKMSTKEFVEQYDKGLSHD